MSLGTEQRRFAPMVADLIQRAYKLGYEISLGDCFRDKRVHGEVGEKKGYGHSRSCHKLKLAIDLNLFFNGEYLTGDEAKKGHNELHDYWDSIGGGRRIDHDLNHFSLEYKGMR